MVFVFIAKNRIQWKHWTIIQLNVWYLKSWYRAKEGMLLLPIDCLVKVAQILIKIISSFDTLLNVISNINHNFTVILSDFNARLKSWLLDINTSEYTRSDALISSYGLYQILSKPTSLLASLWSCIDLIFANHSNLVVDCGVHPFLLSNCHHQLPTLSSILWLETHHHIRGWFGTSERRIMHLYRKQSIWSIGKFYFPTKIYMIKFLSLASFE